jgi:type IV secretory pathway TraG/TraD family ATPase VirD4
MANFRQKICFRTEDETTLNYFNRMLGKVELSRVTESSGSSSNNQGDSSSYNLSTQHYHQDILDAQMMRGLGNDRAVAMLNIDNISCDDVIALKPRYMPEDWQIPSTTA